MDKEEMLVVRHVIEVENVRILFTVKIKELIQHHIVRGLDFRHFKKNDYINLGRKDSKQAKEFLK